VWVRSHWVADDWFVIYRGGGSEQVRVCRGTVKVAHVTPDDDRERGGVARVTHHAVRAASLPPGFGQPATGPGAYPQWGQWGPFRYDAVPDADARVKAARKAADEKRS